jgi:hypothetical protein
MFCFLWCLDPAADTFALDRGRSGSWLMDGLIAQRAAWPFSVIRSKVSQ